MDTSDSNGYNNTRHPFKYKSKWLKYLRVMYTESLATHCNNTLQHTATHCNAQIFARDVYRVTSTWFNNTRHPLESQLWSCPADSNGHNWIKQVQGFTSALTQMDTTLHNSADAKRCREFLYPFDYLFDYLFDYGVATVSRIDKTIGLLCRISSLL